jgi:hypothetical protein
MIMATHLRQDHGRVRKDSFRLACTARHPAFQRRTPKYLPADVECSYCARPDQRSSIPAGGGGGASRGGGGGGGGGGARGGGRGGGGGPPPPPTPPPPRGGGGAGSEFMRPWTERVYGVPPKGRGIEASRPSSKWRLDRRAIPPPTGSPFSTIRRQTVGIQRTYRAPPMRPFGQLRWRSRRCCNGRPSPALAAASVWSSITQMPSGNVRRSAVSLRAPRPPTALDAAAVTLDPSSAWKTRLDRNLPTSIGRAIK